MFARTMQFSWQFIQTTETIYLFSYWLDLFLHKKSDFLYFDICEFEPTTFRSFTWLYWKLKS